MQEARDELNRIKVKGKEMRERELLDYSPNELKDNNKKYPKKIEKHSQWN